LKKQAPPKDLRGNLAINHVFLPLFENYTCRSFCLSVPYKKKYHAIIAYHNYIITIFSITIAKIDFFMDNLEKNQKLVLTKRHIFAIIFSTKRQTKWGRIYGNRKLY